MAGVVIAGLFGIWLYVAINLDSAPFPLRWLRNLLLRLPRGGKLVKCPWCLGFWASGSAYVVLSASEGSLSLLGTPIGAVAAAGVTGLLGSFISIGDDDEGDDDEDYE